MEEIRISESIGWSQRAEVLALRLSSIEETASIVFDRALTAAGAGRTSLLVAFEESLSQFTSESSSHDGIRDVSKAAALATARCHGNIIDTGRLLLGSIDEICARIHLDALSCKENVLLGFAEGACQVGPIVYGRFLDIACEYRDNADDWILKNKRRSVSFDSLSLPVIVPFESELTLTTRPFQRVETAVVAESTPEPENAAPLAEPIAALSDASGQMPESSSAQWSRPKGKGFFRRLSDVMGSIFRR